MMVREKINQDGYKSPLKPKTGAGFCGSLSSLSHPPRMLDVLSSTYSRERAQVSDTRREEGRRLPC